MRPARAYRGWTWRDTVAWTIAYLMIVGVAAAMLGDVIYEWGPWWR